jgi:hypothetical protein
MERQLHLLDSFQARGDDGATYRVRGFEHLVRDDTAPPAFNEWMPTGELEYRLEDGRRVQVSRDGTMHIGGSQVRLVRQAADRH